MSTATYKGIGASPGIAIANAIVIHAEVFIPEPIQAQDKEAQWARVQQAFTATQQDIQAIYEHTKAKLGDEKAEIFEGHLMILEDPDLLEGIQALIDEDGYEAEYALHTTAQQFISILAEMDDEILRERATDVKDITNRIMSHLRGIKHIDLSNLQEECIIVAHDLTPSDTALLDVNYVKGFVTAMGSRTSHSAIMARSLEIPAIVGAGEAVMAIEPGTTLIIHTDQQEVIVHPDSLLLEEMTIKQQSQIQHKEQLAKLVHEPTISKDGSQVELAANIGKLEDIDRAIALGAEGIGLFRSEFLYMGKTSLPTEEEQYNSYSYALQKMGTKSVVIRTLDIGGDKELPYLNLPKEDNPFLGLRALRFCLVNQDLFRTQLRALLRASVHGNLKIMFPMIAVLEELLQAKQILAEEKQKLIDEGITVNDHIEIGMMVEIPSVAVSADLFAPHVDFFSIGTNDLIQYTMAADRMNETLAYLYQPLHPSILRLVKMVIDASNKEGKWVGMCGEMAGDTLAAPLLLGLGLHEFSMSASSILSTRDQLMNLSKAEWTKHAEHTMTLAQSEQIVQYVQQQLTSNK
ncbi:MAG TPA: phosphoenolpyruvate--protein phosphotransferase [Candidatus Paenibacillus intestinavium]|nr:phosphoenolpyruvate--protein phosphotransferase [Candidatus Paenibacillus intestinavium]